MKNKGRRAAQRPMRMRSKKKDKRIGKKDISTPLPFSYKPRLHLDHHIREAQALDTPKEVKHQHLAYWSFLFFVAFSGFALSLITTTLLVLLNHPLVYAFTFFLGLTFGLSYENFLNHRKLFLLHHHILAKCAVLLIAVICIINVSALSTTLARLLEIPILYVNPSLAAAICFTSYLLPYATVAAYKRFLSSRRLSAPISPALTPSPPQESLLLPNRNTLTQHTSYHPHNKHNRAKK